jgi:lipopolysaccharide heptosyltransferase II
MTKKILDPKRILIFNVNWLGDVLFSTPALKALRTKYPQAHIACILHPRTKEMLEGNPNVDEIIIFDEKEKDKHLFNKFRFISQLRKRKFDTVFLFHRSFTRLMLMTLAKIPNRIGYKAKKRSSLFLTKKIPLPKADIHRVDYFLNILRNYGIACESNEYEFFVDDASRKKAAEIFKNEQISASDFVAIINPGGNWLLKRWLPERFAQVANFLIDKFKAKIIISGSSKDIPLAKEIADKLTQKPVILCGRTSLKELGAIIQRCQLFISADSGPMHISAALKTPLIALFGPTSPRITGPIGTGKIKIIHKDIGCKIPCYEVNCAGNRCMQAISAQDCIKAIEEII